MIFVAIVLLAAVALAPLGLVLRRRRAAHGRRESALAIQRAQLAELDRDLADGRIAPAEHATARLEVQRRLLATADIAEPEVQAGSAVPLAATLVLVPVLALALYAIDGHPSMPAAPLAERIVAAQRDNQQAEALIAKLREKLAGMDQTSELARQGYLLLGNAEDSMGHLERAAVAWHRALAIRFDPGLAALTAEAQTRLQGHVSPQSADLFRRALAEAPADAPWRKLAEQRLTEAAKQ
ncbi:MAG TPA: c-type cytochrome biogenesis protein CcmI [Acetobacteraceae bacterium]|nr:c-type cytochrome biogenesis protein CcmI [Acetobacteraceae bacterium]